jgi:hypothetical protein
MISNWSQSEITNCILHSPIYVEFYKSQNYSDRNKSVINTGARDGGGNDKFFLLGWNVLYYGYDGCYRTAYICQISTNCTFHPMIIILKIFLREKSFIHEKIRHKIFIAFFKIIAKT